MNVCMVICPITLLCRNSIVHEFVFFRNSILHEFVLLLEFEFSMCTDVSAFQILTLFIACLNSFWFSRSARAYRSSHIINFIYLWCGSSVYRVIGLITLLLRWRLQKETKSVIGFWLSHDGFHWCTIFTQGCWKLRPLRRAYSIYFWSTWYRGA